MNDIYNRIISDRSQCFMIAEAGVNHNGSVELAYQLVDAAAEAGADAVKFQTFEAGRLVTPNAPKASYQRQGSGVSESQYQMLRRLELSPEETRKLHDHCQERDILFMSTPFDEKSADLLDQLGMPVVKVGSGEITNWPFLEHIARKGKPIILSTGMSYLSEVKEAVGVIRNAGNERLALLHCVSNYPADPAEVNLRSMQTMVTSFHLPVGYSDHTLGVEVALAAAALGANIIEKHFTLDCNLPGPDHQASMEPSQLGQLIRSIRILESSLGNGCKEPTSSEADMATVIRRSLVAAQDIPAGVELSEDLLCCRRPGTGIPPSMRSHLLGRKTRHAISSGTLLALDMVT